MEQWPIAEFHINDVIGGKLLKHVFHHQPQRIFCLHEPYGMRGTGQIFREAAAPARSNETAAILVFSDIGIEPPDNLIAEGTIEVKMELNLGKDFHALR